MNDRFALDASGSAVAVIPGDRLRTRSRFGDVIMHEGLAYTADDAGVVRVAHNQKDTGPHITSFDEFADGNQVILVERPLPDRVPEILRSAWDRVFATRKPYSLAAWNCEDFVQEACGGPAVSQQRREAAVAAYELFVQVFAPDAAARLDAWRTVRTSVLRDRVPYGPLRYLDDLIARAQAEAEAEAAAARKPPRGHGDAP